MHRCGDNNACVAQSDDSCGDDCEDCTLNNAICIDGACQCPNNMRRCPNDNICAEPGDASCGDDCEDCTLSGEYCRSGAYVCLPHSYEFASLAASTEDLLLKLRQYPDETEFSLDEPHQTQATNALPVHIFEIRRLPTAGTTHIAYEGSTYKGERIALMAFHPDDQKWVKIASAPTDGNGDASIQGAISNDYVDPDSRVMRIMAVQELAANGSDTFIFTGDTQNYTSSGYFADGKPNGIYNAIMTYARDEYLAGRAAYFHHAGDMTNNTSGEVLFETEQKIASEAHKIIDDAGMPNGVSVGNHDTYLKLTGGEFTIRPYFEKWFPPSRYEKFFWYGKSNLSPASHFDHYVLVTIADRDFIFINSGYDEYPYDWLNAVASQYSHRIAVINRHSYLSAGNLSPQGTLIYRNVVVKHDNIRLVLCGHTTERGYHYSSIPNQDRTILEIVVDHSNYYPAPEGFGAEGYLRIISFRDGKIINKTYSPYRKQCLTAQDGEGEEFELDFELPDTRRTLTSSFFEAYTDCSD